MMKDFRCWVVRNMDEHGIAEVSKIYDALDEKLFPPELLEEYVLMECLAERKGVDTFLVQNGKGEKCVAKRYDRSRWKDPEGNAVLDELNMDGLPRHIANFANEKVSVTVREYIEGTPLDVYAQEQILTEREILNICVKLCDILAYLHHREQPIIHRDIKPQNIIVKEDGQIALIDFDIARIYRPGNDTDTRFFGTVAYAPPEQYGFTQTDARTDIYALGILLRYLMTGSTRENPNIQIYKPIEKIIRKCTAFAPENRFADVTEVKHALQQANPKAQRIKSIRIAGCLVAACIVLGFGIHAVYDYVTFDPFGEGQIPSVMQDEERAKDAVDYLAQKYGTDIFDDIGDYVTMGKMKDALTEIYGIDEEYAHAVSTADPPEESEEWFFPWGKSDEQYLTQFELAYAVVKVYWPEVVTDWSSLKDDNGEYPGSRVAYDWCQKYGIFTGVKRPYDMSQGEAAIAFANADRVYEAMQNQNK